MITQAEYEALKARYERKEQWLNGRSSYRPEECPADCQISNDEVSNMEVYEFVQDPPDRYVAYVDLQKKIITTWTGETLGTITLKSKITRGYWIRATGINGLRYCGSFYPSAGDYIRLRKTKS